ncbi:hypothetical protein HNP52_000329 [Sphingomonas kyeonggiensis]|uniref:Uncharacterized protein n=1 Tax=Sphingomonas kyeonggiensis TaxID=1268553 RepID=A0A7W7JXR2_9SPHN|nr:hypothetical protein [Sphingomonas kyeonggiensis]MBB4837278.1 hypothetical protein [Sphingomonas kyeonggiensis]
MSMDITVTCDMCRKDITDRKTICEGCAHDDEVVPADHTVLHDLSAAIRRGDCTEAGHLLDRLVAKEQGAREAVERGRFSPAARKAA